MFNARQLAATILSQNPNLVDNDTKRQWVNVIQNNDAKAGEQIANNLLNTYGVKKEDVPGIAQNFFSRILK